MKKGLKITLILLVVLALVGGCIGGYFIWRHHDRYIAKDEALQAALSDAGFTAAEVYDVDVDFESNRYSAWYEVEFEGRSVEYEYVIDAVNGSILSRDSEPEHAGS